MDKNKIKQILIDQLKLDEVIINGNDIHFQIIAIGEIFNDMNQVKKQQAIYAPLMEYIADNRIHSLSIKAYTPKEWTRDRELNDFF